MKKLILLTCLITLIVSCKKKENTTGQTSVNSGSSGPGMDTYEVTIQSNQLRTKMSVEGMTDNIIIKRYNTTTSDPVKDCPITYTFTGSPSKKYRVYTSSVKNATDTTLYMTDSGLTWNYLLVKKNGTAIYENKDTVGYGVGYGSHRITSHDYHINY